MPAQQRKPYEGLVLLIADTYINGAHVRAGEVRPVNASNYGLLDEANRCEIFDPADPKHRAALEATKKADAEAAKAKEKAETEAEKGKGK